LVARDPATSHHPISYRMRKRWWWAQRKHQDFWNLSWMGGGGGSRQGMGFHPFNQALKIVRLSSAWWIIRPDCLPACLLGIPDIKKRSAMATHGPGCLECSSETSAERPACVERSTYKSDVGPARARAETASSRHLRFSASPVVSLPLQLLHLEHTTFNTPQLMLTEGVVTIDIT
jgi:hypothetical protein